MKANYASRGVTLNLRWRNGVIVRDREIVTDSSDRRSLTDVFLSLFDVHAQRQNLSPGATANNSVSAVFAKVKKDERDGYGKRDFAEEMGRLLKAGVLTIEEYGKDKSKKLVRSVAVDAPSTLVDA
jgi:hypothetical protein